MSATTSGALKAYIEALGLSLSVSRDRVADNASLPYVTVTEAIAVVDDHHGDLGSLTSADAVTETAQVSLWEQWRGADGRPVETYGLPDTLAKALRRWQGTVAGRRVYGVSQVNRVRLLDAEANVVQHAYTLTIRRDG